jgi:hypothetical protein
MEAAATTKQFLKQRTLYSGKNGQGASGSHHAENACKVFGELVQMSERLLG